MVAEAADLVAKLDALVEEASVIRGSLALVHRHDPSAIEFGMPPSAGTNLELLIDCARNDRRMCQEPFAMARTLMDAGR